MLAMAGRLRQTQILTRQRAVAGKSSKYFACIPAVKIIAFLDLEQN
jgi:hypothetical protein